MNDSVAVKEQLVAGPADPLAVPPTSQGVALPGTAHDTAAPGGSSPLRPPSDPPGSDGVSSDDLADLKRAAGALFHKGLIPFEALVEAFGQSPDETITVLYRERFGRGPDLELDDVLVERGAG